MRVSTYSVVGGGTHYGVFFLGWDPPEARVCPLTLSVVVLWGGGTHHCVNFLGVGPTWGERVSIYIVGVGPTIVCFFLIFYCSSKTFVKLSMETSTQFTNITQNHNFKNSCKSNFDFTKTFKALHRCLTVTHLICVLWGLFLFFFWWGGEGVHSGTFWRVGP